VQHAWHPRKSWGGRKSWVEALSFRARLFSVLSSTQMASSYIYLSLRKMRPTLRSIHLQCSSHPLYSFPPPFFFNSSLPLFGFPLRPLRGRGQYFGMTRNEKKNIEKKIKLRVWQTQPYHDGKGQGICGQRVGEEALKVRD
jgi:hypothetical protein